MPVHLMKEFLNDLRESRDARFIRQVLNHTIGEDGAFSPDKDDHRYDGIKDAWIRYVSRGASAYRVIFIRKGADIYLYRAGVHAIEENLAQPTAFTSALRVSAETLEFGPASGGSSAYSCLLKTTEAIYIRRHIESMYHVRHKEIYIVSPFVDLELLESHQNFGRFLDRAIEEGTVVGLVTACAPYEKDLDAFKKLEERGINCFFLDDLHAKLYLFDIDLASRNKWQQGVESHAIIGSSNFTAVGLGFTDSRCNEELNCRITAGLLDDARLYVTRLMQMAYDYKKYAFKLRSRR